MAIWTFRGAVSFDEYAQIAESINAENYQPNNILDLRGAILEGWGPGRFMEIQHVFERIAHLGGKTAVVTDQEYHIGIVRMSENIKKAQYEWNHDIRFFGSMTEAEQWLFSDS